jgi:hypothetical protein
MARPPGICQKSNRRRHITVEKLNFRIVSCEQVMSKNIYSEVLHDRRCYLHFFYTAARLAQQQHAVAGVFDAAAATRVPSHRWTFL